MESMGKKMKTYGFANRKKDERRFLENGSIFLKELITDCNGKSIPIRRFSSSQILKATKNFGSSSLVSHRDTFKWFKGIIEDKYYLIKRFKKESVGNVGESYNDIILSARMSNHSNFLKLIGCCFEFTFPVGVFEYAELGIVNERGCLIDIVNGKESILPWSVRLKIAKEIANAVTYLHMAFPKITIHRDIKPRNIFLDKNWVAKLSDFSCSITLPEGKSRIEAEEVRGTIGYIDPFYLNSMVVTEYTDVYSFGIFLLVFITGLRAFDIGRIDSDILIGDFVKDLYENEKLDEIIDPMLAKDITRDQRLQVETCLVLALKCCEKEGNQPKMIQVAKELKILSLGTISALSKPAMLKDESVDPTSVLSKPAMLKNESLDATSAFSKPAMLKDESSMVKWTKKYGIKTEVMLILSLCIAAYLIALLCGKASAQG